MIIFLHRNVQHKTLHRGIYVDATLTRYRPPKTFYPVYVLTCQSSFGWHDRDQYNIKPVVLILELVGIFCI